MNELYQKDKVLKLIKCSRKPEIYFQIFKKIIYALHLVIHTSVSRCKKEKELQTFENRSKFKSCELLDDKNR